MFANIQTEETNEIMEELAEHANQYKTYPQECRKIYSPTEINFDDFEQLFGLMINDNIICVCEIMMPLLQYITEEIDWVNVKWQIIPIKVE
jgi:hypothetical protein